MAHTGKLLFGALVAMGISHAPTPSMASVQSGALPLCNSVSCGGLVQQVQRRRSQDPCLAYHPSVGYFNQCTPEGQRMMRRFDRQAECRAYHPSVGYFDQCTPEGRRLMRRFDRY
jgi:hypothetical protein